MTSLVICTKRVVLIAIMILQESLICIETTHAWENSAWKNGTLRFCYPDMRSQEIFLDSGTSQPLLLCAYSPNSPVDFVNINGADLRFNSKMDNMLVNNFTDDSRQMYYVSVMIDNVTLNMNYVGWLSSGSGEMLEFSFIYRAGQIRLCHYKPVTTFDVMLGENLNVTFCLQSSIDIHKYVGINGDICDVKKHSGHVYCHVTYDPNTGETYVGVGINDVTFDDVGYYVITIKNMKNERLKHLLELKLKEDQTTKNVGLSVTTLITSVVIGVVVIFVIVLVCLVTHYKHRGFYDFFFN
ncbi:uncharacterized protein LOC131950134 isoform X2 [Physella acuta]|uniref:uncharacterized protein LOC131950134 isoform X2 n=1 Tax=Physella acuta TaxID=109671 RepID=UPI0027DB2F34|nr:uncharacterized protein LOC131950134 isoform X2 [Physella acuta]